MLGLRCRLVCCGGGQEVVRLVVCWVVLASCVAVVAVAAEAWPTWSSEVLPDVDESMVVALGWTLPLSAAAAEMPSGDGER